mmetsp:Transcript_19649/g.16789  ORF Transcript_19649/g.16789 Transcript_19649/m.16789 type:complete len:392 (+) Transcript_19649:82-1257(+)
MDFPDIFEDFELTENGQNDFIHPIDERYEPVHNSFEQIPNKNFNSQENQFQQQQQQFDVTLSDFPDFTNQMQNDSYYFEQQQQQQHGFKGNNFYPAKPQKIYFGVSANDTGNTNYEDELWNIHQDNKFASTSKSDSLEAERSTAGDTQESTPEHHADSILPEQTPLNDGTLSSPMASLEEFEVQGTISSQLEQFKFELENPQETDKSVPRVATKNNIAKQTKPSKAKKAETKPASKASDSKKKSSNSFKNHPGLIRDVNRRNIMNHFQARRAGQEMPQRKMYIENYLEEIGPEGTHLLEKFIEKMNRNFESEWKHHKSWQKIVELCNSYNGGFLLYDLIIKFLKNEGQEDYDYWMDHFEGGAVMNGHLRDPVKKNVCLMAMLNNKMQVYRQ